MLTISNNITFKASSKKYSAPLHQNSTKLNTLNKDTVSFGYINAGPVPKDIQLYRAIGKSEFDALFRGEVIEGHSYVTSDPRGWATQNWHNGHNHLDKDGYFVTFKTNRPNLDIMDRRDSLEDTRYSVGNYTLDDVANIRKGHTAHGELVYAENFETEKAKDIQNKKKEINRLVKIIQSQKEPSALQKCIDYIIKRDTSSERDAILVDAFDELGSYCKEFPEIVDNFKNTDFNDERKAYFVMQLVKDADRKDDLPFVRKYVAHCLDNDVKINDKVWSYFQKHGEHQDAKLLLDLVKNYDDKDLDISSALKKLVNENDYPTIEKTFLDGDIKTKYCLIFLFKGTKDDVKMARHVLDLYKNDQETVLEEGDYKDKALISECMKIIQKSGTADDIKLVEPYAKHDYCYVNDDAKDAFKYLKKKYSC